MSVMRVKMTLKIMMLLWGVDERLGGAIEKDVVDGMVGDIVDGMVGDVVDGVIGVLMSIVHWVAMGRRHGLCFYEHRI